MLLEADCVPCILRMSVAALRHLQLDDNAIKSAVEAPLSHENFSAFEQQLKSSNYLVYFGDNAGEIGLEKLLIETI